MSDHVSDPLQAAVAAMSDGFIAADLRTGAVIINAAARHMLGIADTEAVTTQYLKEVVGFYPFDLAGMSPIREELRIGERVLHSVVTPLFDGAQRSGATVVLRDLGASGEVIRQRAEFAQLMAHELRTPLTSIAGALDIVLSGYAGSLSDKQLRYVDMARQGATRMNQMVDQLLDLARAQAGTITVAAAPILLDRLTRDIVRRYQDGALAKQLRIVVSATAEDIAILGDPERLGQVLGNLLANAIRFSPPGGVIGVELFGPPLVRDAVGVSVQNSGEAIGLDERERIFEPFSASSRKIGGTALGLAISRTIIEAHGGRIWVDSDAKSTKFVFTLPAQNPSQAPDATLTTTTTTSARPLPDGAAVLIVDEDAQRALLLKGILMNICDRVLIAGDSDNALQLARSEHPVLTVVSGTLRDARALISILDHDPDTAATAVMALGDNTRRTSLLSAGANDVFEMPLHPTTFRDACLRMVESGRRAAPRVMVVDDDSAIRTICKEVLEMGGYDVQEAANGEIALIEARRFRPDLFVLDVMMPHLDGFALAEALRADPVMAMTPIIFLSARSDTADKVRAFRAGAEDYIVKPFDAAELLARVGKALSRQAQQLGASPTTQLPGVDAIQADVQHRLNEHSHDLVGYLDLDNLKAFNDYYGYAKANAVIRQTGAIIREVVTSVGGPGDFIGHIAGDDFVFVTSRARVDAVSREICRRFDEIIQLYYAPADRDRGYIECKDRFAMMRKFPLMSVSIAAISLERSRSYAGIAELAALGKRAAKAIVGSAYVRDEQTITL